MLVMEVCFAYTFRSFYDVCDDDNDAAAAAVRTVGIFNRALSLSLSLWQDSLWICSFYLARQLEFKWTQLLP